MNSILWNPSNVYNLDDTNSISVWLIIWVLELSFVLIFRVIIKLMMMIITQLMDAIRLTRRRRLLQLKGINWFRLRVGPATLVVVDVVGEHNGVVGGDGWLDAVLEGDAVR